MNPKWYEISRHCNYLHNFKPSYTKKFIKISSIKKGMKVLDAMCGNSDLAKNLSLIRDVELYLLDFQIIQLNKAKRDLDNFRAHHESILETSFDDETFDRVLIRNGIHEISKKNQRKLYAEIHRILKKKGLFVNWELELTKNDSKLIKKIVNKKDRLAGFNELVKNRCFLSKEEFVYHLKEIGFEKIKFVNLGAKYELSTKRWCEGDMSNDQQKLCELNNYINSLEFKDSNIKIKDLGDELIIIINSMISIAEK